MRRRICLLGLSALLLLAAAVALAVKVGNAHARAVQRVVADVDPGIDDLEALVLLINADNHSALKLEAIVVTEGNAAHQYGVRNVFLLLQVLNRLDIPVYVGGKQSLLRHDRKMGGYYGADGLGNLSLTAEAPVHLLQPQRSYEALLQLVRRHPHEVTYITLGPMTSLGMTIWQYPEVADSLRAVYAMGGVEYLGGAEFNLAFDPEAVDIVFRSLKGNMLMVTWEAGSTNSPVTDWYRNITGVSNPAWRFMTRIQDGLNQLLFDGNIAGMPWEHCDPIVPAVLLNPSLIRQSYRSALQIGVCRDDAVRGVITNSTLPIVRPEVVLEIDFDAFLRDFVAAFKGVCEGGGHTCTEVN